MTTQIEGNSTDADKNAKNAAGPKTDGGRDSPRQPATASGETSSRQNPPRR